MNDDGDEFRQQYYMILIIISCTLLLPFDCDHSRPTIIDRLKAFYSYLFCAKHEKMLLRSHTLLIVTLHQQAYVPI